jgi:hypothetical protein
MKYMMTSDQPQGYTLGAHTKFVGKFKKSYRNRLTKVFKAPCFKKIYRCRDGRPLGLHSKRKMALTQEKQRGAGANQVDHCGRWVAKKGSGIVSGVYIDPKDTYADAIVSSKLSLGGQSNTR